MIIFVSLDKPWNRAAYSHCHQFYKWKNSKQPYGHLPLAYRRLNKSQLESQSHLDHASVNWQKKIDSSPLDALLWLCHNVCDFSSQYSSLYMIPLYSFFVFSTIDESTAKYYWDNWKPIDQKDGSLLCPVAFRRTCNLMHHDLCWPPCRHI